MAVCDIVPVAAINSYSAGIVAWRIHTGTIGTIEEPLLYAVGYFSPMKWRRVPCCSRSYDDQLGRGGRSVRS